MRRLTARQISAGSPPLLDADRDKPTVIALHEVAAGKIGIEMLLEGETRIALEAPPRER